MVEIQCKPWNPLSNEARDPDVKIPLNEWFADETEACSFRLYTTICSVSIFNAISVTA